MSRPPNVCGSRSVTLQQRDTHGATEYAPIAAECAYGRKQIADERGPVPHGVAGDRVLLSVFNRRTQPPIRYEISDMVRSISGECECGRPFQLIEAVEGRQEDILYFPARSSLASTISVHPNAFHHLLENVRVTGWQLIQEESGLNVYLAGLRDAGACEAIEPEIRRFSNRQGSADCFAHQPVTAGGLRMISRRRWWLLGLAIALLAVWVAADLASGSRHNLRDFDGHEVGRLETGMWRSYYGHQKLKLFRELAELLRRQYHLPLWQSYIAAYHAAHAAVVFQTGHNRAEYMRALPGLESFYSLIRKHSETPFDIKKVAALELEWWIIHRERAQHQPQDLPDSLAALQSAIYRQPAGLFADHAKARADAMLLRDAGAQAGTLSEQDWRSIGVLLDRSWVSLHTAVWR